MKTFTAASIMALPLLAMASSEHAPLLAQRGRRHHQRSLERMLTRRAGHGHHGHGHGHHDDSSSSSNATCSAANVTSMDVPHNLADGSLEPEHGCVLYHTMEADETCHSIVNDHAAGNMTVDQFVRINPAVLEDCWGMKENHTYCVGVSDCLADGAFTLEQNCTSWAQAGANDTYRSLASANNITLPDLRAWNHDVGKIEEGHFYCVSNETALDTTAPDWHDSWGKDSSSKTSSKSKNHKSSKTATQAAWTPTSTAQANTWTAQASSQADDNTWTQQQQQQQDTTTTSSADDYNDQQQQQQAAAYTPSSSSEDDSTWAQESSSEDDQNTWTQDDSSSPEDNQNTWTQQNTWTEQDDTTTTSAEPTTTTSTENTWTEQQQQNTWTEQEAATTTSTTEQAAETTSASSSSSGGGTASGDATFFQPGLGSCGWTNSASDYIAAAPAALYAITGDSICGKSITLNYQGKSVNVEIVDTCPECSTCSMDLSPAAFKSLADESAGRISMTWDASELGIDASVC